MTDAILDAARILAEARLARRAFAPLPPRLRPADEAAAYQVQAALGGLLADAGQGPLAGFKIGCTTGVMQAYLGIDHPCAGRIRRARIFAGGTEFARDDFVRPGVECEIAVTLARPLVARDAPFDRARVAAAIGSVHAAIEIVDDRYTDWRAFDLATLVADDFFHAALVLGPPCADWRAFDLAALGGVARVNGSDVGTGRGADVLGHPFNALAWLADHCAARGEDLPAGTIVSLGSFTQTRWLDPGESAEIEIEALGTVAMRYNAVTVGSASR